MPGFLCQLIFNIKRQKFQSQGRKKQLNSKKKRQLKRAQKLE
ncbi:hypothetical protein OIU74_028372 [Salix koriyanagi]|uniref:Uncharacterized protein n=1 Tax=Salix koriyanagi TaxID=2511006 RepID=A0A9Q0VBI2_9ROSI|nr:hypothetical protein OIU74_028372 [Salix koriyanagi]